MKNKKFYALFLAIIFMLNMSASIPLDVFAEVGSRTYTYESYEVDYAVLNEWEGNQSIQVTIRNTGTESILNWTLAYRAGGDVNGLWNAVSPKENIIKNAGYNYEITPNGSVSFGYTLSGENLELPEKFEMVSKRANVTEGYEVQFDIYDDWGDGFQGAVTVTNTGIEPLEAWTLSFDTNFTIINSWGGRIIDSTENNYTIASEMWTNPIMPNSSSSFGFTATKQVDTEAAATNFVLTSVKIDENTITEEASITAEAAYDSGNNAVSIMWLSTVPTGTFEVMTSLDGVNFETAATVENAAFYEYAIDSGFGVLYIKIRQNIDGNVVESNVVTVTENAEDIDYELDTDEDGLPDYYEDILGTDKNKADTDGDGLSDGYEVLYLGTNPLKVDSDDNGINDGDEDFDNDGLTNAQECELGTDPNTADTDGDGLNDGAEINIHGTDPLKYDTDGDKVSDGDEIALGLNPNSTATDGTPDNERTFSQIVSSDSEVLSAVNDDNNTPFKVSLEMKSAGVAKNNVYASESGYSYAIENTAIIGMAPEFVYTDGLAVEEVTVKFELENSVINNTLGTYTDESDEFKGIKRLNVFMFFEDVNMLLPIETFHDEATNTVYTKTDRVGTYCLVDMEIFLDNLDKQINDYDKSEADIEVQSEDSEAISQNLLDNDTFSMYNNVNRVALANPNVQSYANSSNGNIDVAFLIDCRSVSNAKEYAKIKRNIIEAADTVFIKSPGSHIKIIVMNSVTDSYLNHPVKILTRKDIGAENFDGDYFLDIDEVYSALDYLEISPSKSSLDCNISDAVNYVCQTYDENYRRDLYLFCIMQNKGLYYNSNNELSDTGFKNWSIQINTAYRGKPKSQYGYARDIVYMTKGGTFNADPDFDSDSYSYEGLSEFMLKQIYNNDYKVENGYKAIIGTGYKTVVFNSSLQQNYEWSNNNMSNGSPTDDDDLDKDGLADYEEIMFKQKDIYGIYKDTVKVDTNGKVDLYTFGEIVKNLNDSLYTHKILFYVENGLERYRDATGDHTISIKSLISTRILPIKSDPTDADGDFDAIPDYCDNNPLSPHNIAHDINNSFGEKYVDTFEILKNLKSPETVRKNQYCQIYVHTLPNSSSKIVHEYSYAYSTEIKVYSVVKSEESYWLKIKYDQNSENMGYVKWNEKTFVDVNNGIQNIIDKFGIYHINLPFHFAYPQNEDNELSHVKNPDVSEYHHIFKTNPEYQGFLMALSDSATVLNEYRMFYSEKNISHPIDGFLLIGIMFTESGAGVDDDNTVGSTQYAENRSGRKAVISALLQSNLAFSIQEAGDLCNDGFFLACVKLINHLEVPLHYKEVSYDISTNFTSYAISEANAIRWRVSYENGSSEFYDYYYSTYAYYNSYGIPVFLDDDIKNDIGEDLSNFISILHD